MQTPMRIREALELIVCPVCHAHLSLQESTQESTPNMAVVCSGCNRKYPVEDGIPVLLEMRASTNG
jgi:uncharacterized protein YbaR (Trm112 family)